MLGLRGVWGRCLAMKVGRFHRVPQIHPEIYTSYMRFLFYINFYQMPN